MADRQCGVPGLVCQRHLRLGWSDDSQSSDYDEMMFARQICADRLHEELGGVGAQVNETDIGFNAWLITFSWHFADMTGFAKCEMKDRKIVKFEG